MIVEFVIVVGSVVCLSSEFHPSRAERSAELRSDMSNSYLILVKLSGQRSLAGHALSWVQSTHPV